MVRITGYISILKVKIMSNNNTFLSQYKEIISYLFWGVMTTIVSWLSYGLFSLLLGKEMDSVDLFGMQFSLAVCFANVLSWICAALFAFFVNKIWVFQSKSWKAGVWLSEFWKFLSARIVSGIIEIIAVPLLVGIGLSYTIFGIEGMVAKLLVSIVVVLLNYFFSKLFIFK